MADLSQRNAEVFTVNLPKHSFSCIMASSKHYPVALVKIAIQKYNTSSFFWMK